MFKPTDAKTPEEYISKIDEPRRSEIQKLHEFIQKTVPDLKPYIIYGMIGYGTYHYKYKSGREGDWCIIALASQKNYISVYVCSVDGDEYVAEKNKNKLGKVSVGKSCIRFKKIEDVNMKELVRVIKVGAKLMKDPTNKMYGN
jgi:uncharacterized protein YdhG (YjbR/CyaY superfamily)